MQTPVAFIGCFTVYVYKVIGQNVEAGLQKQCFYHHTHNLILRPYFTSYLARLDFYHRVNVLVFDGKKRIVFLFQAIIRF